MPRVMFTGDCVGFFTCKSLQTLYNTKNEFVEVVEHACSVTSLQLGEALPSIAKDMDTMSYRIPLGVCAGITPFNFPAMIPLWVCFFVPKLVDKLISLSPK